MRGPKTKQNIFEAATELFSKFGYGEVTMRDIATKAGITEGAIYRHYKGKAAILDEIFSMYKQKFYSNLLTSEQIDEYLETHTAKQLLEYCSEFCAEEDQQFVARAYRLLCRENMVNVAANDLLHTQTYCGVRENIEYALIRLIDRGDIPKLDTYSYSVVWTQAKLHTAQKWTSSTHDQELLEKTWGDYTTLINWMIEVALTGKAPLQVSDVPQQATNKVTNFEYLNNDLPRFSVLNL